MDVALLLGQIKAPSQLPGTIVQAQFKYFKSRNKGSISARGKRIGVSAMGRIGVLRRDCYRARVRGHGRARSAGWEKQSRTTTRTIKRRKLLPKRLQPLCEAKPGPGGCSDNNRRADIDQARTWASPLGKNYGKLGSVSAYRRVGAGKLSSYSSSGDQLGEGFGNRWAGSQLSIEPTSLDPETRNRPGTDDFFILPEFQEQAITSAVKSVR